MAARESASLRPMLADGPGELAWSLRLLGTTGIHVTLLRVAARAAGQGLAAQNLAAQDLAAQDLAMEISRRAFGSDGIYGRLEDGAVAVLLVDSPEDAGTAEARALRPLRQAAAAFGAPAGLVVSSYHAFADEVADADDALLNLGLMPRVPLDGRSREGVAA